MLDMGYTLKCDKTYVYIKLSYHLNYTLKNVLEGIKLLANLEGQEHLYLVYILSNFIRTL